MAIDGVLASANYAFPAWVVGVDPDVFGTSVKNFLYVNELLVIEDLLSAMVGTEGRYICIKGVVEKESQIVIQIDESIDLALQEMTKRIFPLCENFLAMNQFVESRSQFKKGLVNYAFATTIRAFLLAMVAQLEHQLQLGKLSIQGLWFFCQVDVLYNPPIYVCYFRYASIITIIILQPMMGPMYSLSMVVEKASKNDFMGSKVLNFLQSQVPVSKNSKLTSFRSSHHYLECIKAAYDFSSGELMNLIKEKYDLMGKLRSLKRYLDQVWLRLF